MNKGTPEGTIEEMSFVKKMNKKEDLELWEIIGLDPEDHYAVHVLYHKYGEINLKKIKPKADAFIAKGKIPEDYLKAKEYYINETDVEKFDLIPVNYTGVSIKREDSTNYQILKMNPSTFKKIFGSFELGAGASIYCTKQKDLVKNNPLLEGWNTNWSEFKAFFEKRCNIQIINDNNNKMELSDAKKVKNYSNRIIKEIIENNENISQFVFQGIGNFEEPFTVHYLYENGKLKNSCSVPFTVTTGSGRSRGDYTVVIKPKKR